ncbi:hypothetical protein PVAP13_7KG140895 [Panicum virgatum]|uniref:Uncharacterized protein n=1 Tax=Panicum virgatum TaxID=38727 RepID=A0A8T0QI66_PANVG|nr:hypothetical protein PVAP13_7KG140895 [Panicum virgatum]
MVTTLCSGIQVYNHLRFWRARRVKVCKLKQMNETGWDEALDSDHYDGVVKAHPKDAEFLNRPIVNYYQMQVIFRHGVATGKYALGSGEALGQPGDGIASL